MSSGSDWSAPRPPRPTSVVWAHKYGQSMHQEGQSYKEWQAELFSAFQGRPAHEIRDCEAISDYRISASWAVTRASICMCPNETGRPMNERTVWDLTIVKARCKSSLHSQLSASLTNLCTWHQHIPAPCMLASRRGWTERPPSRQGACCGWWCLCT